MSHDLEQSASCEQLGYSRCPANTNDLATLLIQTGLQSLLSKYAELFQEELGTLKGVRVKLVVPENATAKFFKPRPVPYAIRGAIEKDLERLVNLGVIEKTNYSDWAAPIVAVPKPNGTVRICGDYKVTVNPVLQVDQYPVPKAEDLFASLAGAAECQEWMMMKR